MLKLTSKLNGIYFLFHISNRGEPRFFSQQLKNDLPYAKMIDDMGATRTEARPQEGRHIGSLYANVLI